MSLEPTSDLTELVLHVLAHVRLSGPGCVHDPRYCAWARPQMPDELARMLEHDAALLERAWSGGRAPWAVHAWPELVGSIAELRAIATQELRAVEPSQVRSPGVLRALVAAHDPALELLHATLCALAPWYADWHAEAIAPALRVAAADVGPWLDRAGRVLPSLSQARVELSWGLGPRGRGFASRIVVGAPAAWNAVEPRLAAVLALHEQAVLHSGHARYARAEWAALTELAARMRQAPHALREGHAQWLASLELRPLLDELHAEGTIPRADRDALLHDRAGRAARLAALAGRG